MHSAIYSGTIRHRRFKPVGHEFSYKIFLLYLDLAELDSVFEGSRLFRADGRAIAEFRREDHMGDPHTPLDDSVRQLVEARTGHRPAGPIRLLTHLRYFGYVFNPVSFYYCFEEAGKSVDTIVAEVNNTPWGEQHCYVLEHGAEDQEATSYTNGMLQTAPEKAMHVSPFMPMDVAYDWRFGPPGENLRVHMINLEQSRKSFDATLQLQRKELTPASLRHTLLRFPLMTVRVITAIHWQALRLWLKKCPVHEHPGKRDRNTLMEERGQ